MKHIISLGLAVLTLGTAIAVADDSKSLRVATYNIHHARGIDGVVDVPRIAKVIEDTQADLVALEEVDRGVKRTDGIDIPGELGKLTGFHSVFEKNIDFEGGEYGNAILSRYPVIESSNLHYKMIRENEQRGLLHVVVDVRGTKTVFAATHIDYRPDNAERLQNADEILALLKASGDMPVIVTGDFNDYPGKELHKKLKASFTDAWDVVGNGDGFTYPSTKPRSRIDWVLFSRPNVLKVQSAEIPQSEASDHLPLVVTFDLN